MDEPLVDISKQLIAANYEIDEITKQWTILKHEYRSTKDPTLRAEIKEKWDSLQKKMKTLEMNRRKIIEKKEEIEFKGRWKGWKQN
jgi:chaperonin cofactor prefoldin